MFAEAVARGKKIGTLPDSFLLTHITVGRRIHTQMAGLLTCSTFEVFPSAGRTVTFMDRGGRMVQKRGSSPEGRSELTAAGTVADLHGIPFYIPFPERAGSGNHCRTKIGLFFEKSKRSGDFYGAMDVSKKGIPFEVPLVF